MIQQGFIVIVFIAIFLRLFYNYWVYIPAFYHYYTQPIQPNQIVQWKELPKNNLPSNQPNLVLIVADDMGFHDISIYGGFRDLIQTPNIDSIGLNGVLFKNAYAGFYSYLSK